MFIVFSIIYSTSDMLSFPLSLKPLWESISPSVGYWKESTLVLEFCETHLMEKEEQFKGNTITSGASLGVAYLSYLPSPSSLSPPLPPSHYLPQ